MGDSSASAGRRDLACRANCIACAWKHDPECMIPSPSSIAGYAACCADMMRTTGCRATTMRWRRFTMRYAASGFAPYLGEASGVSHGPTSTRWPSASRFPSHGSLTPARLAHDSGYLREEPSAGKPHARIREGEAEWPSYSTYARLGEQRVTDALGVGPAFRDLHEVADEMGPAELLSSAWPPAVGPCRSLTRTPRALHRGARAPRRRCAADGS